MSSESDSDNVTEFLQSICDSPASDCLFLCPVQNCPLIAPIQDPKKFVDHLHTVHRIKIQDPFAVFPFLQQYVEYYAKNLSIPNELKFESNEVTLGNDADIRKSMLQTKLDVILQIQQRERSHDHLQPSNCLFCPELCKNKYKLFEHMFSLHGFNIGLLDNLVEVDEYLSKLRSTLSKLVCIYCEKTFKSHSVLRKHMRKKRHFKIHPHNHKYDKYYVVNFTEPGKSWEALETERPEQTETDELSSSTDDELVGQLRCVCLFDSCVFESPQQTVQHLVSEHSFSLPAVFKTQFIGNDFYACIKIINFLRRKSFLMRCFVCDAELESERDCESHLNAHFQQSSPIELIKERQSEWGNDEYLKPFIENDPLLMIVEEILDN